MTYPAILILAQCVEEGIIDSLVETVEEQTLDDTLYDEVRWNNKRHSLLCKESKDAVLRLLSAHFYRVSPSAGRKQHHRETACASAVIQ